MLGAATALILPTWLGEGSGLRFESPWFLLGLIAVPIVLAAGLLERRTTGKLRFPLASLLAAVGPGWRTWLMPAGVGLRTTAVALLVLALARPQDANLRQETELEGIDIVLTIDVSLSMKASDLEPTRLEAAKSVALDFVKRRRNDRIGAVIFAENAYTLCPLTLDYSVLSNMISELELGVIDGRATAIGNAVGVSLNRLRKSDARSKTIILVTDGTSNAGNISPEQATLFAETLGIKIYTILVGHQDQAPVASGWDFFKSQIFGTQSVPVNPELLRQMSEQTGGAFFEATDRRGLVSSFHAILDALERSRIADQGVVYAEAFPRYLWPGLLLAALDLILALAILRRTP
jgi:Ca-activated chloride channel family protein